MSLLAEIKPLLPTSLLSLSLFMQYKTQRLAVSYRLQPPTSLILRRYPLLCFFSLTLYILMKSITQI